MMIFGGRFRDGAQARWRGLLGRPDTDLGRCSGTARDPLNLLPEQCGLTDLRGGSRRPSRFGVTLQNHGQHPILHYQDRSSLRPLVPVPEFGLL